MLLRFATYLNAVAFLVLIPYLEVSSTHVFNPDWPSHARLHEVWQLVTNAFLSVMAIRLVRSDRTATIGGLMALSINLGFLTALAAAEHYGGGMTHSDGSELLVAGFNPATSVILGLSAAIAMGLLQCQRPEHAAR